MHAGQNEVGVFAASCQTSSYFLPRYRSISLLQVARPTSSSCFNKFACYTLTTTDGSLFYTFFPTDNIATLSTIQVVL